MLLCILPHLTHFDIIFATASSHLPKLLHISTKAYVVTENIVNFATRSLTTQKVESAAGEREKKNTSHFAFAMY